MTVNRETPPLFFWCRFQLPTSFFYWSALRYETTFYYSAMSHIWPICMLNRSITLYDGVFLSLVTRYSWKRRSTSSSSGTKQASSAKRLNMLKFYQPSPPFSIWRPSHLKGRPHLKTSLSLDIALVFIVVQLCVTVDVIGNIHFVAFPPKRIKRSVLIGS